MSLVDVNVERCTRVAHALVRVGVPEPTEPWSDSSTQAAYDLATLNLGLVAVCHQTQLLVGQIEGKHRRGWDFLQTRFLNFARSVCDFASPAGLRDVTTELLTEILDCNQQLTRSDIARRAELLRNCGAVLEQLKVNSLTDLYEQSGRLINAEGSGMIDMLATFEAFTDPVRKKSLFLLGLNGATCGWKYEDASSLDPPVDYHEVRGHLRIGTITVLDDALRDALNRHVAVDESADIAIRSSVTRAIQLVSVASGLSPMTLHYAFWNLFRSLCLRGTPRCRGSVVSLLPESYQGLATGDACCFIDCCDSANKSTAWDEHSFDTEWY